MNLEQAKKLYAHGAGIRTLALLVLMLIGFGVNIGITQGQISKGAETANEAKAAAAINQETLTTIKSEVRVMKDDQEELQADVKQLQNDSMRTLLLVERIATKMRVSTETN